jgi:trigger factor
VKSAVEKVSPTRVKLSVEVSSEELAPRLDAAYKAIGASVNIPGFRRGKVPPRIIDQRFGRGTVVQQALDEALPEYYTRAMQENDLRPLGQPELNLTELPVEAGKDLKFDAEVDVVPEFELPDLSGIEVEVDPLEVSDEDVQVRLDALRARFGTLVGVDRPAAEGDFTSIDLKAVVDGEEVDSVTGVSYEIGSGTMLEGLDEALIGHVAGDTIEFQAPLAGGDRAGQTADITVVLHSVKERQLPELDDEFAQLASQFDTLEELMADLRRQAEQGARLEQGIQARDRLLDKMLELTDIPVPENLVEAEVHQHLEQENRLEDDEHRREVEESTRKAMKTQFLLDALAAREDVQVGQNELVEYIMMVSQQYGMNPNQFAQQLDEQGQVPAMVAEVRRRKALATVLEQAVVRDTEGNPVDLDQATGDEPEQATAEEPAEDTDEPAAEEEPSQA